MSLLALKPTRFQSTKRIGTAVRGTTHFLISEWPSAKENPQAAELVKRRFYVGLGYEEAAQTLGISERSSKRCWAFARAWLKRTIRASLSGPTGAA